MFTNVESWAEMPLNVNHVYTVSIRVVMLVVSNKDMTKDVSSDASGGSDYNAVCVGDLVSNFCN